MLTTLLGDIEIYVDDNKVEYMEKYIRVSDKLCRKRQTTRLAGSAHL